MRHRFDRFAGWCTGAMGSTPAFVLACASVIVWLATGPLYHWDVGWNFAANSSTTVITFLMIFLVQHTVNKDSRALHLKLDELLRAVQGARTGLVDLQSLPEEDLERLQEQFRRLRSGETGDRGQPEATGDRREREDEAGR